MILVLIVFIGLLVLKVGFQLNLDRLNRSSVLQSAGEVPEAFREVMDEETYNKSVSYTLAKNKLSFAETLYDGILLAIWLLPWLNGASPLSLLWDVFSRFVGTGLWGQGFVLFLVSITLSLPGVPWEWYGQFRLEERFGFNKSTVKLWVIDKIKGLLVGFVLGYPILVLILWLVSLSTWWWLWAACAIFVFQLVMMVVYPMFIMPLFNKFEELEEGSLRSQLMALGDRTGFKAKTILVMDGSKRSGHSNAFFTGFGAFRRIVLFDTLMEQLNERELSAVLAHEIGHYRKGHIPKMIAVSGISLLVSFALLGWLADASWFASSFGFSTTNGSLAPVLMLFGLLSGLVSFWLTPISNRFSRKHEYEADAFAKDALDGDPQPLIKALHRLSEKNLSNLTPHPRYSAFYYSHPTLLEREAALLRDAQSSGAR